MFADMVEKADRFVRTLWNSPAVFFIIHIGNVNFRSASPSFTPVAFVPVTEHVLTDRNFDFIADTAGESIHLGALASRIASHFRIDGYVGDSAGASASDLRRGGHAAAGF